MTSMIGRRMFIFFTGHELPAALPINHGRPITDGTMFQFCTLLGEVTGETPGGLWFRLEKMFGTDNEELSVNLSDKPEYFLAWGAFRRALLAKGNESAPPPREWGFRPN
jgi:hypothetical protein